jgi:hypothetical protein
MGKGSVQMRRKNAAEKLRKAVQKIRTTSRLRKVLLFCGILAPLLYAVTDIFAGTLYPGYSFTNQAVSELFAIGAPTSSLVVPSFTVYSLLLLAFALGVWVSSGQSRARRILALVMVGNAINGLVLWNFFPMHMRGTEVTFTDTIHLILAATGGIFGAVAIGLGAIAFGGRFRFYSIGTIVTMFAPTILTFSFTSQVAANEFSPWLGLSERIAFAVYWQWQIILAIVLLQEERRSPQIKS